MMLRFHDPDGDAVVVESDAICAVTVGSVRRPMEVSAADHDPHTVTLVHTAAGQLIVAESLEAVLDAWRASYATRREVEAHAVAR